MIHPQQKFYSIEPMEQAETTSGGLIIRHSDEMHLAKIVEAGPEISVPLDAGTEVMVNWSASIRAKISGRTYFLIPADQVQGVWQP